MKDEHVSTEENEEIVDLTAAKNEKCRVCHGVPASRNYGAIVCASCKNFFLRITTTGAKVPACKNLKLCVTQNFKGPGKLKCATCRYEKCIQAGMIPEITARRSGCNLREKRAKMEVWTGGKAGRGKIIDLSANTVELHASTSRNCLNEERSCSPRSSSSVACPDSREIQLAARVFSMPLSGFRKKEAIDLLKDMIYTQEIIMNDDLNRPVEVDFSFSMDVSLAQILQNPLVACPRVPIAMRPELKPLIPEASWLQMVGRIFCRSVVLFADWCRSVPEFRDLDAVDQINFFARQVLRQILFNNFYYTHKYDYKDGMLTTLGSMKFDSSMLHKQFQTHHAHSYYFYTHFGMTIVIPCMGLTEKSAEVARKAFNKYCHTLLEHLKMRYRRESVAIEKFTELMELPKYMQVE
ncbi:unnamed protein product, partial [Mesorhabditis belari]|uniref:Nuclear receptor domain-containing protein n=1 Tax=Mesorhabditis belari TaxID=2138241 RepID=A0AAF3FBS7_9BILA